MQNKHGIWDGSVQSDVHWCRIKPDCERLKYIHILSLLTLMGIDNAQVNKLDFWCKLLINLGV